MKRWILVMDVLGGGGGDVGGEMVVEVMRRDMLRHVGFLWI
jgi:hypothetical protein